MHVSSGPTINQTFTSQRLFLRMTRAFTSKPWIVSNMNKKYAVWLDCTVWHVFCCHFPAASWTGTAESNIYKRGELVNLQVSAKTRPEQQLYVQSCFVSASPEPQTRPKHTIIMNKGWAAGQQFSVMFVPCCSNHLWCRCSLPGAPPRWVLQTRSYNLWPRTDRMRLILFWTRLISFLRWLGVF